MISYKNSLWNRLIFLYLTRTVFLVFLVLFLCCFGGKTFVVMPVMVVAIMTIVAMPLDDALQKLALINILHGQITNIH